MSFNKIVLMALIYLIEGQEPHPVESLELKHRIGDEKPYVIRRQLIYFLEKMLEREDKEDE